MGGDIEFVYTGEKPGRQKTWEDIHFEKMLMEIGVRGPSDSFTMAILYIVTCGFFLLFGLQFYELSPHVSCACVFFCAITFILAVIYAIDVIVWCRESSKHTTSTDDLYAREQAKWQKQRKRYELAYFEALKKHCSKHHLTLEIRGDGTSYRYYPTQRDFVFRVYKCKP